MTPWVILLDLQLSNPCHLHFFVAAIFAPVPERQLCHALIHKSVFLASANRFKQGSVTLQGVP
ncbi:hypothetical protein AMATHDRAFT_54304 [Amanita thiersii Skay4041]|uniref:Uncharacterized protein n=1 Tax=Amanita thiersii Skay4041 TaxID=703135 RepID=A0A2A9NWJ1_9AGAR|nr:hypothetical protein AMATHDRAFT_54304 [Amanita thiersii Skay4041]